MHLLLRSDVVEGGARSEESRVILGEDGEKERTRSLAVSEDLPIRTLRAAETFRAFHRQPEQ